jgi:hypothetical protein
MKLSPEAEAEIVRLCFNLTDQPRTELLRAAMAWAYRDAASIARHHFEDWIAQRIEERACGKP